MLTKPASVFTQIAAVVLAIGIGAVLFLWAGDSARKRIAMDQGRKDEG